MHPLCHNALSHILTLAVGARWFGHEHFHAQVPAARRRGPHLSDIIAGHRGDPDSHGAATPGQTRARTDLPHRDQDLKSPLCVCRTPDVLCSRATSWTSCLHFNHSTLNAQQRELPPPVLCATRRILPPSLERCLLLLICIGVTSPHATAMGHVCT